MGFSCGCDDYPEFYNETAHRARKEHTCYECGHAITPGQEYKKIFMVFEGDPSTYKICERCDDLMAAFADVGYCVSLGDFFDSYGDWLEDKRPCPEDDEDPPTGGEIARALQAKHKAWSPTSVSDADEEVCEK